MTKFNNYLYRFSLCFMKYTSLFIGLLLFLCGFFFTCYAEDMTTQQVLTRTDNLLLNILGILLLTVFLYGVYGLVRKAPAKGKKILLGFVMLWYLLGGIVLILFSKTVPSADALSVYSAASELAAGNTGVIHPTDSYLSYYPQQIGLTGYLELLIRLWNLLPIDQHAYHFLKCINILWAEVILYFQYKSVQLLFKKDAADILYLLLAWLHLPLLFYTSFVYGEIPSFALFSVGAWMLLKLLNAEAPSKQCLLWAIGSALSFAGAVALRKNTLVLMIAVILVVLLEGLHKRKGKLLLLAITYGLLSCLTLPLLQNIYEHRADNVLSSGVTATSYIAMGMQESSRGNGWYNGFNFNTYQSTGMDTLATNELSRQAISERFTYFKEQPSYALSFYGGKFLSQWCDGSYASRQATLATFGGRNAFFQELYEGGYSVYFIEFCNILQNQIYLGVLLFAAFTCKKKTSAQTQGLPLYLFMIAVLGGLLFHMLWEANSRYILPYGLLLLPYAAYGMSLLMTRITLQGGGKRRSGGYVD